MTGRIFNGSEAPWLENLDGIDMPHDPGSGEIMKFETKERMRDSRGREKSFG